MLDGPADTRPATHRRLLACDAVEAASTTRRVEILTRFATRAYRRPATTDEVDRLVEAGRAGRASAARSSRPASSSPCRRSWSRRTSSSASSWTTGPTAPSRTRSTSTSWPPGCRTSSGAACPTTSCSPSPARSSSRANLDAAGPADAQGPEVAGPGRELRRPVAPAPPAQDLRPRPEAVPAVRRAAARGDAQGDASCSSSAIVREDRSILDLLDADFTFLNERLARHYGIATPTATGGQKPASPAASRSAATSSSASSCRPAATAAAC